MKCHSLVYITILFKTSLMKDLEYISFQANENEIRENLVINNQYLLFEINILYKNIFSYE